MKWIDFPFLVHFAWSNCLFKQWSRRYRRWKLFSSITQSQPKHSKYCKDKKKGSEEEEKNNGHENSKAAPPAALSGVMACTAASALINKF